MELKSRTKVVKNSVNNGKSIIYWMSREQRVKYNFALLAAMKYAAEQNLNLYVAFCVSSEFLGASPEAFAFIGEGLKEVESVLGGLNVPFYLLYGNPPYEIAEFTKSKEAKAIICDFDPLRIKQEWLAYLNASFDGSIYEIDSRNIVPARLASNKKEFAAHTIRPKIKALLPQFLIDIPLPRRLHQSIEFAENDYSRLDALPKNRFFKGGKTEALRLLNEFIAKKLDGYAAYRNDPTKEYQSELSPYLHFGQISSLEVALAVQAASANAQSKDAFLEELIVRRELAENFCLYCADYDNENSLEPWAKANMAITDGEPRDYLYSTDEFEDGKTHDELWNAAQTQLKIKGKIHGYMRMYWAKKILEWTPSTKDAFKVAVYLNDKYALDGRDPNGYAGIAWSLGGVHDRAWPSRKVFGKIRYMNYNGCKSKFKVNEYIARWTKTHV